MLIVSKNTVIFKGNKALSDTSKAFSDTPKATLWHFTFSPSQP